jgi:hypothetical protein
MARSYRVKPNDLIECSIFVDTRGSRLRVLQDAALYSKATGQPGTVSGLIEADKPLPEGVFKETASFARSSFAIQQEIDANSMEYVGDNVRINIMKRDQMRIRYLLRDWTLTEGEENKKINLDKQTVGGRTSLTDKAYTLVMNEIEPALIQGFLICLDLTERAAAEEMAKQAVAELKEGSGINAKN